MRYLNIRGFILALFIIVSGCASPQERYINNDNELDLYLSTLDDKHFVWCELDLEQCRKDFEVWKLSSRGQAILGEYENEDSGQTYNTHDVPNVFRTRFLDERQLVEESRGYDSGQYLDVLEERGLPRNPPNHVQPETIPASSKKYGPEVLSQ